MKIKILLIILLVFIHSSLDASTTHNNEQFQKAVLVTGASSGIGKRTAEILAAKGYFVYAGARKEKDLKALSANKNILGVRLDVTVQSDIDNAVKLIEKQGRGLHGLVNNAGVTVFAPLIEVSEQDMQFQMDVNLFGPYRVTKAFAPLLIENKGRIVNISSVVGLFTGSMIGPYAMSKYAIEAYSESLQLEMKKFDVSVSIIEPGNYNSNIIKTMKRRMQHNETSADSQYQKEMQQLFSYFSEDRSNHKDPDEVSYAVLDALTSDDPKLRYMVVPNKGEAAMAIRKFTERLVEVNYRQPYSYSAQELLEVVETAIKRKDKK